MPGRLCWIARDALRVLAHQVREQKMDGACLAENIAVTSARISPDSGQPCDASRFTVARYGFHSQGPGPCSLVRDGRDGRGTGCALWWLLWERLPSRWWASRG